MVKPESSGAGRKIHVRNDLSALFKYWAKYGLNGYTFEAVFESDGTKELNTEYQEFYAMFSVSPPTINYLEEQDNKYVTISCNERQFWIDIEKEILAIFDNKVAVNVYPYCHEIEVVLKG